MGEEHPLATKWKQDTNVAFAKWYCAEPAVIKPPFHQQEFKNDKNRVQLYTELPSFHILNTVFQ